jgi:dTDP-4-amino-4,6-dideoxygalactose transaminase
MNEENIQVLKPFFRVEECLEEIRDCLDKSWTGMGYKTNILEKKWCEFTNLPYAHFLNSATAGLDLGVRILKEENGWGTEDEIITSAFTFVSTNHAILYHGLKPVFADIDDSLNLSPADVLKKITKKTKAVLFVGLAGNTKNLSEVRNICLKKGLKFILDASHMAGSRIDNVHVGVDCDLSIFSFQAVKNLPTADSGMICFLDAGLDKKARELSWLGITRDTFSRSSEGSYKWDYDVNSVGMKYHGNSIIASLGIVALKYLEEDNSYRRNLAMLYETYLGKKFQVIRHEPESARHLFQIVLNNRESYISMLASKSIFTGVHYKKNTAYKVYEDVSLPKTDFYSDRVLSLPLHMNISEVQVMRICDILNSSEL